MASTLPYDTLLLEIAEYVDRHSIDMIILAGYLQLVPADVTRAYAGRMINVHPAPLPRGGAASRIAGCRRDLAAMVRWVRTATPRCRMNCTTRHPARAARDMTCSTPLRTSSPRSPSGR